MSDPIVLDTCVFSDNGFLQWLYDYRGRKIIPMVAFMEWAYYFRKRGRDIGAIKDILRRLRIEIEPFEERYASRATETLFAEKPAATKEAFNRRWRDHAIGGHAHTAPLRLITHNIEDFGFLEKRANTPYDFTKEMDG